MTTFATLTVLIGIIALATAIFAVLFIYRNYNKTSEQLATYYEEKIAHLDWFTNAARTTTFDRFFVEQHPHHFIVVGHSDLLDFDQHILEFIPDSDSDEDRAFTQREANELCDLLNQTTP